MSRHTTEDPVGGARGPQLRAKHRPVGLGEAVTAVAPTSHEPVTPPCRACHYPLHKAEAACDRCGTPSPSYDPDWYANRRTKETTHA